METAGCDLVLKISVVEDGGDLVDRRSEAEANGGWLEDGGAQVDVLPHCLIELDPEVDPPAVAQAEFEAERDEQRIADPGRRGLDNQEAGLLDAAEYDPELHLGGRDKLDTDPAGLAATDGLGSRRTVEVDLAEGAAVRLSRTGQQVLEDNLALSLVVDSMLETVLREQWVDQADDSTVRGRPFAGQEELLGTAAEKSYAGLPRPLRLETGGVGSNYCVSPTVADWSRRWGLRICRGWASRLFS